MIEQIDAVVGAEINESDQRTDMALLMANSDGRVSARSSRPRLIRRSQELEWSDSDSDSDDEIPDLVFRKPGENRNEQKEDDSGDESFVWWYRSSVGLTEQPVSRPSDSDYGNLPVEALYALGGETDDETDNGDAEEKEEDDEEKDDEDDEDNEDDEDRQDDDEDGSGQDDDDGENDDDDDDLPDLVYPTNNYQDYDSDSDDETAPNDEEEHESDKENVGFGDGVNPINWGIKTDGTEVGRVSDYTVDFNVVRKNPHNARIKARKSEEMREMEQALVGAGIGGGFGNTQELHVLNYNQAMKAKDSDKWCDSAVEEHYRMIENGVWVPRARSQLTEKRTITSTWAMKKKASGKYRARVNARGFEQIAGVHYNPDNKAAPVANMTTIRIIFVLMVAARWYSHLLDVKGAFLKGRFGPNEEKVMMEVPQGFQHIYEELWDEIKDKSYSDEQVMAKLREICDKWKNEKAEEQRERMRNQTRKRGGVSTIVLLLIRTIYGLVQSASAFWRECRAAFEFLKYKKTADPSLYFRLNKQGERVIWMTWVDDCFVCGKKKNVDPAVNEMEEVFDCDNVGEMNEYVGTHVKRDVENLELRLVQPVIIQSFRDEFGIKQSNVKTPAENRKVLPTEGELLDEAEHKKYRSGVGKLMYLATWSRPDLANAVRELSRHVQAPTKEHYKAMERVMEYCVNTPNRGYFIKPNREWDEADSDYLFDVEGLSDASYAENNETRTSVSGSTVKLLGVPVVTKSSTQTSVKLSVTESELDSAVTTVQFMMYVYKILLSLMLKVKLPMILYVDNTGVRELINGWGISGRTRHIQVKEMWLRELRLAGLIAVRYIPGAKMCSDLLTKNLDGPTFHIHLPVYVGEDEYWMLYQQWYQDYVTRRRIRSEESKLQSTRESVRSHVFVDGAVATPIDRLSSERISDEKQKACVHVNKPNVVSDETEINTALQPETVAYMVKDGVCADHLIASGEMREQLTYGRDPQYGKEKMTWEKNGNTSRNRWRNRYNAVKIPKLRSNKRNELDEAILVKSEVGCNLADDTTEVAAEDSQKEDVLNYVVTPEHAERSASGKAATTKQSTDRRRVKVEELDGKDLPDEMRSNDVRKGEFSPADNAHKATATTSTKQMARTKQTKRVLNLDQAAPTVASGDGKTNSSSERASVAKKPTAVKKTGYRIPRKPKKSAWEAWKESTEFKVSKRAAAKLKGSVSLGTLKHTHVGAFEKDGKMIRVQYTPGVETDEEKSSGEESDDTSVMIRRHRNFFSRQHHSDVA